MYAGLAGTGRRNEMISHIRPGSTLAVNKTGRLVGRREGQNRHFVKSNSGTIIHMKERNFIMLKKDLILRNPLRILARQSDYILSPDGLGAVLARAGVGKTAFLVQLSLHALLKEINVLHISLNDAVDKVTLWYREVFKLIADQYEIRQAEHLWESILPHRFIMTFKVEGFSVPKLKERLTDLTEQNIFVPQIMIIDGLPFNESVARPLTEIKSLGAQHHLRTWFTVRTHRHEASGPDGLPNHLKDVADLFDAVIELQPEGKDIHINALKGCPKDADRTGLRLDPATMLIKDPL
jgi:hypothetical protein